MKLAAITCLYGCRETARQRANYWACAAALKAQGVDLWTVQGLLPWQYHAEAIDGERMLWVPIRDFLFKCWPASARINPHKIWNLEFVI